MSDRSGYGGWCRPVVIDHHDSYTASLVDLVARVAGTDPDVVQHDEVEIEDLLAGGHTHVVLSPGPGHPDRPGDFSIGRELVARTTVPVLGVCLGHQGIVSTFGGRVAHVAPAHGTVSTVRHDGGVLFRDLPPTFQAVRYHSLAAVEVPSCLRVTAWCDEPEGGRAVMAVEHRTRPVHGVQFHPESVLSEHGLQIVRNFFDVPASVRPRRSSSPKQVRPPAAPRTGAGTGARRAPTGQGPEVRRFPWVEPADFFATHVADRPRSFWLDGEGRRDAADRYSYVGWLREDERSLTYDAAARTVVEHRDGRSRVVGADVFDALREASGPDLPGAGDLPFAGGWVGYLGYACRQDLPARVTEAAGTAPDATLMRVTRFLAFDHEAGVVHAVSADDDPSDWFREVEHLAATTKRSAANGPDAAAPQEVVDVGPEEYALAFNEVRDALLDGDSYETNLTYRVRMRAHVDPLAAFGRLRALGPAPYAALLRHHDVSVVSASPECFLRVDADRYAESRPIKGTTPRASEPDADARQRCSLTADTRFVAENLMVTDLVRHDLATVCEPGSVSVPVLMGVESYPNVHQLVTTVRGRLGAATTTLDAIWGLFPPASMTGAPKRRTMEIVERVEASPRGVYSGVLGWIGDDARADLGVVIRTATIVGDLVEIGTGGAVTVHSDAAAEYAETRWKIAHLTAALVGTTPTNHPGPAASTAPRPAAFLRA